AAEASAPATSPPRASKPQRPPMKIEIILPRRASGEIVWVITLVSTLHMVRPKPKPNSAHNVTGSGGSSDIVRVPPMVRIQPADMARIQAGGVLSRVSRSVPQSEPAPEAPSSQPRVRLSPA